MRKYRVLCLTDHSTHSEENSVYALLRAMHQHGQCDYVDVATRGDDANMDFFNEISFDSIFAVRVDDNFSFDNSKTIFSSSKSLVKPIDYDIVFLRLPRPLEDSFLSGLADRFSEKYFVNNPLGIIRSSNKSMLLDFQDVCPPIKLCRSIDDIVAFANVYDIVLKPLHAYGGKGILRIKDGVLDDGEASHDILPYLSSIEDEISSKGFLAMKYMENVGAGDKRLIVVDGTILAASLRLPPEGSWLCNVAMGGTSVLARPDEDEERIVENINPRLMELGILIYGVDTLVNEQGRRILSEINTLSIGGFPQAQRQSGKPVIKLTIDKIFHYAGIHYKQQACHQ